MKSDDDLTKLNPVKNYTSPKLPTLQDTCGSSEHLKKLPKRWQTHAKVIACAGLLGVGALALGWTQLSNYPAVTRERLMVSSHIGGAVGNPIYVVHLTEQEAFGILRMQLEAAGLNFNSPPPDYTVYRRGWGSDVTLDLFDEDRGVAIANISWEDSHLPFMAWGSGLAQGTVREFAELTSDISVGVFYNPGHTVRTFRWGRPGPGEMLAARATARPLLEANLTAQVQNFIDFLQSEGILE